MKLLMVTDSIKTKTFFIDPQKVNCDLDNGVYPISIAKKFLTTKAEKKKLSKVVESFDAGCSSVAIIFDHKDEKEIMKRAISEKMNQKLDTKVKLKVISRTANLKMDQRLKDLLDSIPDSIPDAA